MSRRDLERRLERVAGFAEPRVELEQYATPAPLAAHLVHLASIQGDLVARTVVDLGTGTGVLALGAALAGAERVLGIDVDPSALAIARSNEATLGPPTAVDWLRGDATRPPLCPPEPVTVLMNPPFGAQRGNVHADREFLAAAAELGAVSYSVHNAGSRGFVEAYAADHGGGVTNAVGSSIELDRQFPFHTEAARETPVEVFRIEWDG